MHPEEGELIISFQKEIYNLRRMKTTGKIDTKDVKVSSVIAQRPDQEQQVKDSGGSSDQPVSNREGDAQVATKASSAPLSEAVGGGTTVDILKEGCLCADAKLLSWSGPVESQEQTSFDQETKTLLSGEDKKKKPRPSSAEIAQDEDELSGKKTSYGDDLRKMIVQDEDEQHSDKIGLPGIEDLKQGNGGAGWRAFLDIDDDSVSQMTSYYFAKLRSDHPDDRDYLPPYEPQQLTDVYERLALYRIRGYQLLVDQQLAEPDDENLKKCHSSADLFDEGYFEYYEESLEWYFDPELCKSPGYDDYQRLVLYNHGGEYLDWDYYHSTLNTYEKDLAYVQYCEALANKTKWIEDYLANSTHQWNRVENVAFLQALQIATGFANVSPRLILFAFDEHIWSILFDHSKYKDMDGLYFEIWKRVAKLKKDFREALLEIYREKMFPLRAIEIEHELDDKKIRIFYMKDDYDAYVADIDKMASDDQARQDIRDAVFKMFPKPQTYVDYIQKKVIIAKEIVLIGKTPPQLTGDESEARTEIGSIY